MVFNCNTAIMLCLFLHFIWRYIMYDLLHMVTVHITMIIRIEKINI